METIDRIFLGDDLVAVHVRGFPAVPTTEVSPRDAALQLMTMNRPAGQVVKGHRHVPHDRVTHGLQECLIVVRGKLRYDLFDRDGGCFKQCVLEAGHAMLILGVAHGVEFLEDSLVYELKNGPYIDDKESI